MIDRALHILAHPAINLLIGIGFIISAIYEIVLEVPQEIEESIAGAHYALLLLGVLVIFRSLGEISEAVTSAKDNWQQSNALWFHRAAGKMSAITNRPTVILLTAIFLLLGGGADAWEYFDTADTKGMATAAMVILIALSMLSFILLGGIEAVEKLDEDDIHIASLFPAQLRSSTVMLIIAGIVFSISIAEELAQAREFFEFPTHRSAALWGAIEVLKNITRSISLARKSMKKAS